MAKKYADRLAVVKMCEDIYESNGDNNVKDINFLKFHRRYRLLKDATAVRYAYIRYLKREKGLELEPWSGLLVSKRVCDQCKRKISKLFRFRGQDICASCLNPDIESAEFAENSSPMGHFEYKGM